MNNIIDINEIMRDLEEKIKKGLSEKSLDITGISKLIGEHLEKAKDKVLQNAGDIISNEVIPSTQTDCKKCKNKLKKQKIERAN